MSDFIHSENMLKSPGPIRGLNKSELAEACGLHTCKALYSWDIGTILRKKFAQRIHLLYRAAGQGDPVICNLKRHTSARSPGNPHGCGRDLVYSRQVKPWEGLRDGDMTRLNSTAFTKLRLKVETNFFTSL
jgi:hypothetical protein